MGIVFRPYQTKLESDIYSAWDEGHKNVLAVMPTGAGKTKTFAKIAINKTFNYGIPSAIAVHRKELVEQISLTLAEENVTHNIIAPRPTILGIVSAQRQLLNRQFYDYRAPISVISVDTLNARIKTHANWANGIGLWITDEATHLLRGNKWGRAVECFPNAIGLGVTATPQRLDKRGLGRHADGVFDTMVEGPSVRWLIANGFLCSYKIAVPASDYRDHLKKTTGDSDFSHEAMAHAALASHIIGDVVTNYKKFASDKQAILFASDIVSGTKMEQKFRDAGIAAKLLHGETDDKIRRQAMNDFRDRKIKVLLNVDLFDEGLDVPGIECVIMARPTKSLSKYLQMVGRGLRPAQGKQYLILIDHVGNVPEHGLPDTPRLWTLDRIVKRRDTVNLLRICSNFQCNAPYDRALTECPYCGTTPDRAGGGGGGKPTIEQVDGDLELLDPETLREMYEGVELEDPGAVARRVGSVAGPGAAKRAELNQVTRIDTQNKLSEAIAHWAGRMRRLGYGDRSIHKRFYLEHEKTITTALSEPTADMLSTMEELRWKGH